MLRLIILTLALASCTRQPVYPPVETAGDEVVIEVSLLKQEEPQFFTYRFQDRNISFFLIKLDRKVMSFLDACASCFRHKRGYRSEAGSVSCRFCNMQYPLSKLEKGLGGCYPLKIEGRIEGERYLIPVKLLQAAVDKF